MLSAWVTIICLHLLHSTVDHPTLPPQAIDFKLADKAGDPDPMGWPIPPPGTNPPGFGAMIPDPSNPGVLRVDAIWELPLPLDILQAGWVGSGPRGTQSIPESLIFGNATTGSGEAEEKGGGKEGRRNRGGGDGGPPSPGSPPSSLRNTRRVNTMSPSPEPGSPPRASRSHTPTPGGAVLMPTQDPPEPGQGPALPDWLPRLPVKHGAQELKALEEAGALGHLLFALLRAALFQVRSFAQGWQMRFGKGHLVLACGSPDRHLFSWATICSASSPFHTAHAPTCAVPCCAFRPHCWLLHTSWHMGATCHGPPPCTHSPQKSKQQPAERVGPVALQEGVALAGALGCTPGTLKPQRPLMSLAVFWRAISSGAASGKGMAAAVSREGMARVLAQSACSSHQAPPQHLRLGVGT